MFDIIPQCAPGRQSLTGRYARAGVLVIAGIWAATLGAAVLLLGLVALVSFFPVVGLLGLALALVLIGGLIYRFTPQKQERRYILNLYTMEVVEHG